MKYIVFFALCFSVSYYLTNNTYQPGKSFREPSSEDSKVTRNSYSNLPCPSEKDFMAWSAELNMDPIEGPNLDSGCKSDNNRTKLAQVLALAKQININFPKKWAPSVQAEIKNSFDYIKRNTKKMKIDLSQTDSIARNQTNIKQIELGGLFFKEEPLEALGVLMHEARHSDSRDQSHTTCFIGDILKTQGGCDHFFSNRSADAGAYGYGTLYELALGQYSNNLDNSEKELMITDALRMLGTRFNTFKSTMAKHFDIITVLLEDGTLAWLHPYTFELVPLNIELPKFQEKIKKIEFAPRTNSLMLFTESNRLFVWGPRNPPARPYPDATSEDDRYFHMSRQYVPYNVERTDYTTLKTNGVLEYFTYDAKLNKYVVLPYPLHTNTQEVNPTAPNVKYFLLGHGFNSYFIDKQGLLTRAHRYGNEPNFIFDANLQSNAGGWKNATGGVYYTDLILTDADGKLNNVTVKYESDSNGEDSEIYSKEFYKFQTEKPAKKYQQGLQFHAALDEDGGLSIENYREKNSRQYYQHLNKKIIDFVITRLTFPESNLYKPNNFNDSLLRKCNIKKVIEAIGYGSVMGINQDSRIVVAYPDSRCSLLFQNKQWTNAELIGVDDTSKNDSEIRPFGDVFLKLTNQNEKISLAPYMRSSLDQSK